MKPYKTLAFLIPLVPLCAFLLCGCIDDDSGGGSEQAPVSADLLQLTQIIPEFVREGTYIQGEQLIRINGVLTPVAIWEFVVTPETRVFEQFESCSKHEVGASILSRGQLIQVTADLNDAVSINGQFVSKAKTILVRNEVCLGLRSVTNEVTTLVVTE